MTLSKEARVAIVKKALADANVLDPRVPASSVEKIIERAATDYWVGDEEFMRGHLLSASALTLTLKSIATLEKDWFAIIPSLDDAYAARLKANPHASPEDRMTWRRELAAMSTAGLAIEAGELGLTARIGPPDQEQSSKPAAGSNVDEHIRRLAGITATPPNQYNLSAADVDAALERNGIKVSELSATERRDWHEKLAQPMPQTPDEKTVTALQHLEKERGSLTPEQRLALHRSQQAVAK